MKGQMSIEDWMPEACPGYGKEPEVGAIIHKHGQNQHLNRSRNTAIDDA